MVCIELEPGAAGWKAQTNPLSYYLLKMFKKLILNQNVSEKSSDVPTPPKCLGIDQNLTSAPRCNISSHVKTTSDNDVDVDVQKLRDDEEGEMVEEGNGDDRMKREAREAENTFKE